MILAARLYGAGNKDGLPADWPAEVIKIRDAKDAPEGWLVFDDEKALEAYKADRQASYDAWKAAQPKDPTPKSTRELLAELESRVTALEQGR